MAPTAHSRAATPPRAGAPTRREIGAIAAIGAVALALRLWNLLELRAHDPFFASPSVDELMYHQWASAIARGEGLGDQVFLNGPAYPVFLAGIYGVTGPSLLAAKAVQCVLSALDCVLVWLLGRRLLGSGIALGAAALLAVCELAIFYPATLLLEGAQGTLILLLLFLCVRAAESGGAARWGAAGLATGIAALARPSALIFAALWTAWAALRPGAVPLARARSAAAFAGAVLACVSLSALHNARAGGDLVLVSYAGGMNLFIGNNPTANGEFHVPPLVPTALADDPEEQRMVFQSLAERATGRTLKPSEVSAFWSGQALDWVRRQPAAFARLVGRKIALSVNRYEAWNVRSLTLARDASAVLRLPLLDFAALAPFAVLGLWGTRGAWVRLMPLYAWLATTWLTLWIFFVISRYRVAALPVLALFASAGVAYVLATLRARRRPALAGVAVALLALTLAVRAPIAQENLGVAYYNLGNRLRERGEPALAVDAYLQAIQRARTYLSAYNNLALAYEDLGWHAEATTAWRAVAVLAAKQGSAKHVQRAERRLQQLGAARDPGSDGPP
jgi:4-amino-4-deoxy-L-arabinose transferase-like glycosyltransferase